MFTVVNISGSSNQVEKQSITLSGARLRPGAARDIETLSDYLIGLHDAGIVSITPPPGASKVPAPAAVEEIVKEVSAPEGNKSPEKTEDEPVEEPEDEPVEVIAEDPVEEPAEESEEEAEDAAPEEEVPEEKAEETVEAVVDEEVAVDATDSPAEDSEAPEASTEEIETTEEVEETEEEKSEEEVFDVDEFMTGTARELSAKIKDMDLGLYNENKSKMYDHEINNAGRTTIISLLK